MRSLIGEGRKNPSQNRDVGDIRRLSGVGFAFNAPSQLRLYTTGIRETATLMDNPELRDLVDAPRERLDVEYKAWLDLSDNENRAKTARHMCALANFGSGYLVFGISDDMTPAGPRPVGAGPYDQDSISGIVKRYLKPAFQVACYDVTSSLTGVVHPVVWIPSHDAVPICSTRDGPQVNGKPVGIAQGTYYTRAPGPESVPVTTPEMWAPIIRRCVLHERTGLLAGLEPLLRSPGAPVAAPDDPLRLWHEAAHTRFLSLADKDPLADQLKRAHYQLSYQVNSNDNEHLDMDQLVAELRSMGQELHDLVDPGWTMFWIFDVPELGPYSGADATIGEAEFLECSLISEDVLKLAVPDFWRVAPSGKATIIRPYREDRRKIVEGFEPGTWFWPYAMGREIAEVIRHARAFTQRFARPETVSFRAEWRGLQGREVKDPINPMLRMMGRTARSDTRTVTCTVPVADLSSRWAEITAEMLSPVTRLFDPNYSVSAQEILAWSERFRR